MSPLDAPVLIRPLRPADLAAALEIQAASYPAFLQEDAAAFRSRLEIATACCLAATRGDKLVAYLLAHGWPGEAPPAVGTILPRDAAHEVLFIHDLAVVPAGRGTRVGERLVAQALAQAGASGLARAELIAVEGAENYWRRQGFADAPCPPALAAKVAAYGPDARWMARAIG